MVILSGNTEIIIIRKKTIKNESVYKSLDSAADLNTWTGKNEMVKTDVTTVVLTALR